MTNKRCGKNRLRLRDLLRLRRSTVTWATLIIWVLRQIALSSDSDLLQKVYDWTVENQPELEQLIELIVPALLECLRTGSSSTLAVRLEESHAKLRTMKRGS